MENWPRWLERVSSLQVVLVGVVIKVAALLLLVNSFCFNFPIKRHWSRAIYNIDNTATLPNSWSWWQLVANLNYIQCAVTMQILRIQVSGGFTIISKNYAEWKTCHPWDTRAPKHNLVFVMDTSKFDPTGFKRSFSPKSSAKKSGKTCLPHKNTETIDKEHVLQKIQFHVE